MKTGSVVMVLSFHHEATIELASQRNGLDVGDGRLAVASQYADAGDGAGDTPADGNGHWIGDANSGVASWNTTGEKIHAENVVTSVLAWKESCR